MPYFRLRKWLYPSAQWFKIFFLVNNVKKRQFHALDCGRGPGDTALALTWKGAGRVLSEVLSTVSFCNQKVAFCGRQRNGLCSVSIVALQLKNELKY